MILCINTVLGAGSVTVFEEKYGKARQKKMIQKRDLVSEIHEILVKNSLSPREITKIYALQGPGPFTAVRNLATIMNAWKLSFPQIELFPLPTGVFLQCQFPDAEHIFLSAGKSAFFLFNAQNPTQFQKLPIAQLSGFSGIYGGYLRPDAKIPDHLQKASPLSDEEVFGHILKSGKHDAEDFLFPIYGAEAHISAPVSTSAVEASFPLK